MHSLPAGYPQLNSKLQMFWQDYGGNPDHPLLKIEHGKKRKPVFTTQLTEPPKLNSAFAIKY